mmetsp:Transcript_19644/g.27406  ORF Transcript_19644/g.27406 Transcript_19644/m.27406 type:complete len:164 (-) Transcript_19644:103-594(-)
MTVITTTTPEAGCPLPTWRDHLHPPTTIGTEIHTEWRHTPSAHPLLTIPLLTDLDMITLLITMKTRKDIQTDHQATDTEGPVRGRENASPERETEKEKTNGTAPRESEKTGVVSEHSPSSSSCLLNVFQTNKPPIITAPSNFFLASFASSTNHSFPSRSFFFV